MTRARTALPFALGALAVAAIGGRAVGGCSPAATVTYTGRELPVMAQAEALTVFPGPSVPEGFTAIGVVSVRCQTLDRDADPRGICGSETLLGLARARAAAAGASALLEPACEQSTSHLAPVRADAGAESLPMHSGICQVTVLRAAHEGGVPTPTGRVAAAPARRTETVTAAGVPVRVVLERGDRGAEAATPRSADELGELGEAPAGYALLGPASAECAAPCSPTAARLALKQVLGRAGASALIGLRCEPVDPDRWRCEARGLGRASPAPGDAGTATPSDAG